MTTYNLLPHQRELMRILVAEYEHFEGRVRELFVLRTGHKSALSTKWELVLFKSAADFVPASERSIPLLIPVKHLCPDLKFVTLTQQGTYAKWIGGANISYEQPLTPGDFAQLADEGLLGVRFSDTGKPIYQITQANIDVVKSDFSSSDAMPLVVVTGSHSAIAIGANAVAIAAKASAEKSALFAPG